MPLLPRPRSAPGTSTSPVSPHELAAHLQRAAGDAGAAHHVQEAIRYYQQWGATALIAGLEARIAARA